MNRRRVIPLCFVLAALCGCASLPTGPSVTVLPAPGKPFEVFQADDAVCRQWAQAQIGGTSPGETANQSAAGGAVIGTIVGAGLGAAIGAATGNVGAGAAIGGATGLLGGASIGANQGALSAGELQRRYDTSYLQCMYSKGNQVPTYRQPPRAYYAPPPPPGYYYYPPPYPR
ncbi:MAG: glycine zipper family protein [Syntrophorhabdales bacterium]|jgi:hypothetical protein